MIFRASGLIRTALSFDELVLADIDALLSTSDQVLPSFVDWFSRAECSRR
jgi:hypothetical protein